MTTPTFHQVLAVIENDLDGARTDLIALQDVDTSVLDEEANDQHNCDLEATHLRIEMLQDTVMNMEAAHSWLARGN